jgi:hypothetical protein
MSKKILPKIPEKVLPNIYYYITRRAVKKQVKVKVEKDRQTEER